MLLFNPSFQQELSKILDLFLDVRWQLFHELSNSGRAS
jgi:hypothetical protein